MNIAKQNTRINVIVWNVKQIIRLLQESKKKQYLPCKNDRRAYLIDLNIEFKDDRVIKYKRS